MGRLFLVTYAPLVRSRAGREASEQLQIPPFVDGSIRREPDLEHDHPAISCLCHAGKFAPRLEVGDHVVYLTKRGRYRSPTDHWRLAAILRANRLFDTHLEAADWYISEGMQPPNNCMVRETAPRPVRESHQRNKHKQTDEQAWQRAWDLGYRQRARKNGRFVVCDRLWAELGWDAPIVQDDDLLAVFGGRPGTRNPGALPLRHLRQLTSRLGIALPPSAP